MRFKKSAMTHFPSEHAEHGRNVLAAAVDAAQDFYRLVTEKFNLTKMSPAMKRNLKIAGIAVAGLLLILIALPLLINVNSFRPKIESEVTNALGRPVSLGDLSLSI